MPVIPMMGPKLFDDMTDFSKRKIIVTSDGSHSLKLEGLDEHYHSTHGALQESTHVFIRNGLLALEPAKGPLNILEVGFGTGLNALLALQQALKMHQSIRYMTLEPFPLEPSEYSLLNFPAVMNHPELDSLFQQMHQAPWEQPVKITDEFEFHKTRQGIKDCPLPDQHFHLVFFDAFAPDVVPDLWTPEVFGRIARAMTPRSILVTYCAKGMVRRAMKSAGLHVEKLPGPPGKREMTRARKVS